MGNNKGITLIELIAAIAILTIVGGAAASLIVVALKSYSGGSAEAGLQYEAQLASNQMQELIIDCSGGVTYSYTYHAAGGSAHEEIIKNDSAISSTDSTGAAITVTGKNLYIYNEADYYCLHWDKTAKTLELIRYEKTAGSTPGGTADPADERERTLLSNMVEKFQADLGNLTSGNVVEYTFTLTRSGTGRSYTTTGRIRLRNTV